jgi:hypothetical protein
MATRAQIEANRRNAQNSTGPRTPEGKTTVGQNALRHGLCGGIPTMYDESYENEVKPLLDALIEENQPVGANEEILVYKMAEHFYFQRRASWLLAELFDAAGAGEKNSHEVSVILRYHGAADRGFMSALNDLRKLQKERKLQEIGFVSQNAEAASAEIPAAEPPQTEPLVAIHPSQPQTPVDFPAAAPAEPSKSVEKEIAGQQHIAQEAA